MWHPFKAPTSQCGLIFWRCQPAKVANLTLQILSVPVVNHIDVWSESGSKLEEEIFEKQTKKFIFAFEPVGCLRETDISRSSTNTKRSSDFHRLNGLEWSVFFSILFF